MLIIRPSGRNQFWFQCLTGTKSGNLPYHILSCRAFWFQKIQVSLQSFHSQIFHFSDLIKQYIGTICYSRFNKALKYGSFLSHLVKIYLVD